MESVSTLSRVFTPSTDKVFITSHQDFRIYAGEKLPVVSALLDEISHQSALEKRVRLQKMPYLKRFKHSFFRFRTYYPPSTTQSKTSKMFGSLSHTKKQGYTRCGVIILIVNNARFVIVKPGNMCQQRRRLNFSLSLEYFA